MRRCRPPCARRQRFVQVPGTWRDHPARRFVKYLLERLRPLMSDYTVRVEVGLAGIPYPTVEQGDELASSGVTAAELAPWCSGTGYPYHRWHHADGPV
jgi:AMP nucleosidase